MNFLLFACMFLLTISTSYSFNKVDFNKFLDKEVKSFLKKNNIPGLAIGYIKASYDVDEPISCILTYGDAQKFPQITIKDTTVFRLGRTSQIFLGLLLSKAIEENLISLDEKAFRYLSKSFTLPRFHEDEISMKDLAFHLSSLPKEPKTILKRYQVSVYEIKNYLKNYKLTKKPGVVFERSDLGYSLLACCLEHVFKTDIDQLLKKEIFDVLHMERTTLKEHKKYLDKLAVGYKGVKVVSPDKVDKNYSFFSPSTGILSTPEDMQKFMRCLLQLEKNQLSQCLKIFYQQHVLIPDQIIDKIGFGPKISPLSLSSSLNTYKITSQYHGFSSTIAFVPDTKTSVFLLVNSEESTEEFALKILSELNKK